MRSSTIQTYKMAMGDDQLTAYHRALNLILAKDYHRHSVRFYRAKNQRSLKNTIIRDLGKDHFCFAFVYRSNGTSNI